MHPVDPLRLGVAFLAAFLAGAINSVAGGGTMISFPVLVALGLPSVVANATNTVGIWPGTVGSIWGFRKELKALNRRLLWLLVPAASGGLLGAWLLRHTATSTFDKLVPVLLFFATAMFMIQGPVQRYLKSVEAAQTAGTRWLAVALLAQLAVAIYGGYFGAGMSIMNLSILGLLGMTDILEMNAMTSLVSFVINGVAGVLFAVDGLVEWHFVAAMVVGALAGGYGAVGAARRIGKPAIRKFVIGVGLFLALAMAVRVLRSP
jgi:uncharacterized membrane protein YfcA